MLLSRAPLSHRVQIIELNPVVSIVADRALRVHVSGRAAAALRRSWLSGVLLPDLLLSFHAPGFTASSRQ